MKKTLAYLFLWLILSALGAWVAWQGHATTIYLALRLIETPSLRPTGWVPQTLAPISRLSLMGWAALCLVFVMVAEGQLREAADEGKLLRQAGWWVGGLGVLWGVMVLVTVVV